MKKRLCIVFSVIFFLFGLLVFQFFRIQIVEGDKWALEARKQHCFLVREPFIRGTFYSNPSIKKGHPMAAEKLAIDVYKYHVYIDPIAIPKENRKAIETHIKNACHLSEREQLQLTAQFEKKSRSRKIVSWIDEKEKNEILLWWTPYAKKHALPLNAIFFISDCKRVHPFGKLLGQVLHTVREQKTDQSNNAIPTGGLELFCDTYLRGIPGKKRLLRSPRHALESDEPIQSAKNGADVYLTVDLCLQAICEEEIEKGVKKSGAKAGWAVMMHPQTGEIMALAQYPFFYPDDYSKYFNDKDRIGDTKNKAITDAHEPGSIMKIVSLAIVMKANKIVQQQGKAPIFFPNEKVDTSSGAFPGRSKPIKDTHFHHYLDMKLGFQKSSNIYIARQIQKVVQQLGDQWYQKELELFGFGTKTGIELPGESAGLLPRKGRLHPNGRPEWSVPTPYSLAIGYNLQATSVQILRAISAFANGGKLVQPTLIRKIVARNASGVESIIMDNTQEKETLCILDPDIVNEVVSMMKLITKRGGTAALADIHGYTEAGKTSTDMKLVDGKYSNRHHVSSFIGFAPVGEPAFVLLVTLDEPALGALLDHGSSHHGGRTAAPVFREIGARTLEYLGIPPDDPYGYPYGDPRRDTSKADMMREVERLERQYQEWNGGH